MAYCHGKTTEDQIFSTNIQLRNKGMIIVKC